MDPILAAIDRKLDTEINSAAATVEADCESNIPTSGESSSGSMLPQGTIALMKQQADFLNDPKRAAAAGGCTAKSAESTNGPDDPDVVVPAMVTSAAVGVRMFQQLHVDRVATYRQFDSALKLLLESGDMFSYQKQSKAITEAFASCSARVNGVSAQLRNKFGMCGGSKAAEIIDAVQRQEERKLQVFFIQSWKLFWGSLSLRLFMLLAVVVSADSESSLGPRQCAANCSRYIIQVPGLR
eukprot:SAG31_NODE_2322_length_5941_cov_4.156624_5_plen_240_part_00